MDFTCRGYNVLRMDLNLGECQRELAYFISCILQSFPTGVQNLPAFGDILPSLALTNYPAGRVSWIFFLHAFPLDKNSAIHVDMDALCDARKKTTRKKVRTVLITYLKSPGENKSGRNFQPSKFLASELFKGQLQFFAPRRVRTHIRLIARIYQSLTEQK